MLLVLDIGNTHAVVGLYKGKTLVYFKRVASNSLLKFLSQRKTFKMIKVASVASVVPALDLKIKSTLKNKLKIKKINFVTHKNTDTIKLKVDNPKEVGADRICNMVGAYSQLRKALLIVDLGTATTIDYVDSKGCYRGGVIAPGLKTSAQALYEKAAKLPRVSLVQPKKILGKNTLSQIQSGVVTAHLKMIEVLIKEICIEIKSKPQVIVCGGLGSLFSSRLKVIKDPYLTLKGLWALSQKI
jgi:type III pantothenate kinase